MCQECYMLLISGSAQALLFAVQYQSAAYVVELHTVELQSSGSIGTGLHPDSQISGYLDDCNFLTKKTQNSLQNTTVLIYVVKCTLGYIIKIYILQFSKIMVLSNRQCSCSNKNYSSLNCLPIFKLSDYILHTITFYLQFRPNDKTTCFILVLMLLRTLKYLYTIKEDNQSSQSELLRF